MPVKSRNQKIRSAPLATKAALRALYPNTVPVSISQLTREDMLKKTEVLCHIMDPVSNPTVIPSLRGRTMSLIEHLPSHLQTVADLPGISETTIVRAIRKLTLGSDRDVPKPSELCMVHKRLSGQLIASARYHLERAIRKHLPQFMSRPGVHSPVRSTILSGNADRAIRMTEDVMGMLLTADEFLANYKRTPPEFCTDGCVNVSCDACILTKVGSSTTIVSTLGAVALLRIGSGHSKSPYWLDWLDGWVTNLEESPGKLWNDSKVLAQELIKNQNSLQVDESAKRGQSEEVPLFLSPQLLNGEVDYARQQRIIDEQIGKRACSSARATPDRAPYSASNTSIPGYSRVVSILDCYSNHADELHLSSTKHRTPGASASGLKSVQGEPTEGSNQKTTVAANGRESVTTDEKSTLHFSWPVEFNSLTTDLTSQKSHDGPATPIASSICLPDFQPAYLDSQVRRCDVSKDQGRGWLHNSHISLHLTPPTISSSCLRRPAGPS